MKEPFVTGFGTIPSRDTVLVKLTTSDHIIGYGESAALTAPVYLSETIETCWHVMRDFLLPALRSEETSVTDYVAKTAYIREHKIAKFGVECALWSIDSQEKHISLATLLGGTRKKIEVGDSIGIQPNLERTLEVVEKRLEEGYKRIKVKIKPGWDIELVDGIRSAFPDIVLMVDANSSYTLKDLKVLQKLDAYHLLMIEQPLGFDDIIDHAKLQKQIATPICLDESITSLEKARQAIEIGACRIINIKPGRIGSLLETRDINELAKKAHIPLWCGGMIESGIGKAYNMAAASLSEFSLPADMSPSEVYFDKDVVANGIKLVEGEARVSEIPGLGYEVDEEFIKKCTVKQLEVPIWKKH